MSEFNAVRCPMCHARMTEGFIPTGGGMHWLRRRDASGVEFAESLPGTFAWFRRTRLPAWRCKKCELVLFRYGRHIQQQLEREDEARRASEDQAPAPEPPPGG